MAASRALIGVAARSIAVLDDEVTLVQFRALVLVADGRVSGPGDLAIALDVHPSNTTRVVDRMVDKGLLVRSEDKDDRRSVSLAIGSAGHTALRRVMTKRRSEIGEILGRLPPAAPPRWRRPWPSSQVPPGSPPRMRGGLDGAPIRLPHRYKALFVGRREELGTLARSSWQVVLLAAVVGVATGAGVALLETVIIGLEERVAELPLWIVAGAPAVGLLITAVVLRWIGGGVPLHRRRVPEGVPRPHLSPAQPSLRGADPRSGGHPRPRRGHGPRRFIDLHRRQHRHPRAAGRPPLLRHDDRRVLLVAGAAAGVAAIFKAPATGAVFALEVPYQDEFARHMLIPSLVGAATGYLTFAAFHGTDPLFPIKDAPPFNYVDLLVALALGAGAGLGARLFARGLRWAKDRANRTPAWQRVTIAGATIAVLILISEWATGAPWRSVPATRHSRGPRTRTGLSGRWPCCWPCGASRPPQWSGVAGWAVSSCRSWWPGHSLGRLVGGAVHELQTSLFTVIGVAAFLGAGYRVPLAAVMFVAEATGHPGFVVPGLLAAVAAELVMGRSSVTAYQRTAIQEAGATGDPPSGA